RRGPALARGPSPRSFPARSDVVDVHLDRAHRQPGEPLHFVRDTVAHGRGDLGEVEAVLDDDVQVDRHAASVLPDLDASGTAAGARELTAQGSLHPDDAVALERSLRDDLRYCLTRDRDPPQP